MSGPNNVWQDISIPAVGELSARRVDKFHPHEFFWARDHEGAYLFLYQPASPFQKSRRIPAPKGIKVAYSDEAPRHLKLILDTSTDWELFYSICTDLMNSTRNLENSEQIAEALIIRLEKWQKFLSKRNSYLLNEYEIKGLIGELLFLKEEVLKRYGSAGISFWEGPLGKPQDFSIGNTVYEVKCQAGASNTRVHISLPQQLWPQAPIMYLVVYSLGKATSSMAGAFTLPELIESIRNILRDEAELDDFESRLLSVNYIEASDYSSYVYVFNGARFFRVREGFPKIEAESIPEGVSDLKYMIELDKCQKYLEVPEWDVNPGEGKNVT